MKTRLFIVIAVLVGLGILGMVLVSTADAATCSGTSCNDTDPSYTGCSNGSYSLTSRYIYRYNVDKRINETVARIDLRYSPSCKTKWARIQNLTNPGTSLWVALRPNHWIYPTLYNMGWGWTFWTRQRYAPSSPMQACGIFESGKEVCTDFR